MPGMKQTAERVYAWFEQRLQLEGPVKDAVLHKVPRNTASWWYVFGSAAFTLLFLQIFTGILLALIYVPSAGAAWSSLNILNHQIALGWFLRAMHGWGSNFMVAIVLIHMAQVFLFGAYKFPRELTWILGVFLLLMTLGMAFTGQVLRFDQDAYWGLGIGASIVSRVPWIGGGLVHLMLGGPTIAGATLSRFFALHVFVIPGHDAALRRTACVDGLEARQSMSGRCRGGWFAGPRILQSTARLAHEDGIPFVPGAFWKDLLFSGAVLAAVAVCAFVFGPFGPGGQPDPSITQTVPKPDFFFLWIYTILSYLPPAMETPLLLIAPIVGIAILLALPFYASEGEKSWHRRPVAVLAVSTIAVSLGRADATGNHNPVEPAHGRVEQRSHPRPLFAQRHAARPSGRRGFPGQAMPQLPLHRRSRRRAWTRAGRGSDAHDHRPDALQSCERRRQHAGLRQESHSA